MNWIDVGLMPYGQALALQHQLVEEHKAGTGSDTVLLLEHPPVLTLGRRANESNILASPETLREQGIEVFRVERGGDVTYHGPGQLVGYPILDLRHFRCDVSWYVESLSDVLIRTLRDYGVQGRYSQEFPGVWVGDAKVVAIGARISTWITSHGFAFNVNPNMQHWELIVPCGIHDKAVTSLAQLTGKPVSVSEVLPHLVRHFGEVFETEMNATTLNVTTKN
jgi:lipoyl(octanoyl) transferase